LKRIRSFPIAILLISYCLSILFCLSKPAFGQQWSGLLAPNRAVDWSSAGAGAIPSRTGICQTLGVAGQSSTYSQSVTAANIQSALLSCAGSNQAVYLNPGTYAMTQSLFTYPQAAPNNVTLRGAGASQTILKWSSGASLGNCNGTGAAAVCIYNGDSGALQYSTNILNVTGGVTSGSTSITLGSAVNGALSNLKVGSLMALNQLDDALTDNGNSWTCGKGPSGSTAYCTWGGASSAYPGRQQTQIVTVTGVSGSTVTFTPGLYGPKWSNSKTPYATFSSILPVKGFGIENLRVDVTSLGELGAIVEFMWATNSWVKGVETINNTATGSSGKVHYQISSDAHITVRDSYMYGANPASSGYGVDFLWGTSDSLAENNISQHMPTGFLLETGTGNVFGYNFAVDNNFGGSWQQCDAYHHGGGDAFDLWEGQEGTCAYFDDGHGTSYGMTLFRDYFSGYDPANTCPSSDRSCTTTTKNQNTAAVMNQAFNRYNNLVANVLGNGTYARTYQNQGATGSPSSCPGFTWQVLYSLNFANGNQTPFSPACQSSAYSLDNDSLVSSTLMRWGNYDTVNGSVQTNSGETASGSPAYPGLSSPSTSWSSYKSLYLSSAPSWWGTMPWPAVGPDVTGGNIANVGGHAYHNPAANCYLNVLKGSVTGSSGPLSFDASTCYGSSAASTSGGPPAPLSLTSTLVQ
jgi:hypothetical protein